MARDSSGSFRNVGLDAAAAGAAGGGGNFATESIWQAFERLRETDAADPLLGRWLGDVKLSRVIAEGGMGRVYEADQRDPPRRVAVKVLRPGLFAKETVRRFVREVSMLGSLRHPGITQVYSAGTYEIAGAQLPYFVMELITDALPLTEYARARCLTVTERLRLFQTICDAVAYGHERGIVHRDLKPSNLLVDGNGHPKVIDFGVARGVDSGHRATTLTEAGQLVGTIQYMSPEQLSGQGVEVDARCDVYSLGVVLYELLADCPVHDLNGRPLVEAARIVQEQRPRPLRSVNPAVPRHAAAVVHRCLCKDQESRFRDAAEVSAAIGSGPPGLRSLITEGRWAAAVNISAAGVVVSGAILCCVYFASVNSWHRLARLGSAVHSGQFSVVSGGIDAMRPAKAEGVADPAAALMLQPAEIERDAKAFRFAIRDVNQQDADAFLVENVGMKRWTDQFMFPRVSYWAPTANNREGMLVYRFDFGGRAESIHMQAVLDCWDFSREAGGVGRGAAAIEISRDGENWVVIEDNIEPRRWGASIAVAKNVPTDVLGSESLWVRVRCITENAPVDDGYNVAQFARTRPDRTSVAFEVTAKLRGNESETAAP